MREIPQLVEAPNHKNRPHAEPFGEMYAWTVSNVAQRSWSEEELGLLATAMNWVIPPDSTPGAGTAVGIQLLLQLVESEGTAAMAQFRAGLATLVEQDLADPAHPFAPKFIDYVRDSYYGHPENGAWSELGFVVSD